MTKLFRTIGISFLLAAAASGDDWLHLGRDEARTRIPAETIISPALLGSVAIGGEAMSSPVAADGFLVAARYDRRLLAWRESDLAPLWSVPLEAYAVGTPAIDRGRIFVPCVNGSLYVYRLADGALLWTVATGGSDFSSPLISGNWLYMGSGFPNQAAIAVDLDTRAIVWSAPLDQITYSSPALDSGKLLMASNSGRLHAFNSATGAADWSYSAGGTLGPASPVVSGASVFLLSGRTVHRVTLATGAGAGSLVMTDPAPPTGNLGVDFEGSSLIRAGGSIVGVVRFRYAMNLDGDFFGYPDARVLREVAFSVDASTMALQWRVLLGQGTVPSLNAVPPYGIVPTPVATGPAIAFASSATSSLTLLLPSDGSVVSAFGLDGPSLASPIVANARLYALSRAGMLHAFQGVNAPPAVVTGLSPNGTEFDATPPSLSWNASEAGSTYLVRMDDDGEILMDWDFETTVGATTTPCPPLADGFVYTWGVRARDPDAAYGPWSLASFGQNVPPAPPASLLATPRHQKVQLSWAASPSPDAAGYRLFYGPVGGPMGPGIDVGAALATVVSGLTNGVSYEFQLRTVDQTGDLSAAITAVATPVALITIGGTGFDTLHQAAAAAHPGQIIRLGADTFLLDTTLVVPRGVELRGVNALVTRILATAPIVMIAAQHAAEVRLLTLAGGTVGVKSTHDYVVVANCVIRDMTDAGIEALGTLEAVNNTIVRNARAGVRASVEVKARNNIVQENGIGFEGPVESRYNDVSDGYSGTGPGLGDRNAQVVFIDPASGDYREQALQPSLDAGDPGDAFDEEPAYNGRRINMGAFGNTLLAATSPPTIVDPNASFSAGSDRCFGAAGPGTPGGISFALTLAALLVLALRRRS